MKVTEERIRNAYRIGQIDWKAAHDMLKLLKVAPNAFYITESESGDIEYGVKCFTRDLLRPHSTTPND